MECQDCGFRLDCEEIVIDIVALVSAQGPYAARIFSVFSSYLQLEITQSRTNC